MTADATTSAEAVGDALGSTFGGTVLAPGDAGFDDARKLFNARWADRSPAVITQCADEDDVVLVMRYASGAGIPVAIRSGGHGIDGKAMAEGALVVDVSRLRDIEVRPEDRWVRVQAGVLLGELDAAAQEHGLAVPSGTVSVTGVTGLTLGGGVGYLMRRFGMTVDNLLACDMVTVSGEQVRASETENPDLFWGLRGAGHNLGVVTALEFRAHPVGPQVASGMIGFPQSEAAGVMRNLREYMKTAPRELAVIGVSTPCPPFPPVPAEIHGVPVLMFVVVYSGDMAHWEEQSAGLAALGKSFANLVRPTSFVEANSMLDVLGPWGRRVYTRGGYLPELADDLIDEITALTAAPPAPTGPGPSTVMNLWAMGGAAAEADEDSMAFSREGAEWFWEALGNYDTPEADDTFEAWVLQMAETIAPYELPNGYVNLTLDRGPEWLRGLYGKPEKFERLRRLKREWDPQNLLRFNKNILPVDG